MLSAENLPRQVRKTAKERLVEGLRHRDWKNYTSIFKRPEPIQELIQDNPLLIVHPGFKHYWTEGLKPYLSRNTRKDRDYMEGFMGYQSYLERLKSTTVKAARRERTILVFTPTGNKRQTLEAIGFFHENELPQNMILVPTIGDRVKLDAGLIGFPQDIEEGTVKAVLNKAGFFGSLFLNPEFGNHDFYAQYSDFADYDELFFDRLFRCMNVAEICGEWRKGCVKAIEGEAKSRNISVTRLEDCTFPLA